MLCVPWPRRGRLLRHLCFSSSFPRLFNPGGQGHVKGARAHRAQRGRPLTWPRRDYLALPEEEEKRRSNRQPLAAARGRTGEQHSRQPPQQDRWLPLREHWPCWRHGSTQPGSKRPIEQHRSAATCGGRGGASPPHGTPAHASPSRPERAPYPLHAQCLRPMSTRGDVRQATASRLWWLPPRGGCPPGTRSASRRGPQGARPVGPRASAPPHAGHRGTSCRRQTRSWPRQDASN